MDPTGFARGRGGAWTPGLSEGYDVISKEQWDRLEDKRSGSEDWQPEHFPSPATPMAELVKMLPPPQLIGQPGFPVATSSRSMGPVRSSIGVAQRRHDGKAHLELVISGPGSAWVPSALAALQEKRQPSAGVIDPRSEERRVGKE